MEPQFGRFDNTEWSRSLFLHSCVQCGTVVSKTLAFSGILPVILPLNELPSTRHGTAQQRAIKVCLKSLKKFRKMADLKPSEAARLCHATNDEWRKWKSGSKFMHPAAFKVFLEVVADRCVARSDKERERDEERVATTTTAGRDESYPSRGQVSDALNKSVAAQSIQKKIDPECICRGTWRDLVRRYKPLFGKKSYNRYFGKTYQPFWAGLRR